MILTAFALVYPFCQDTNATVLNEKEMATTETSELFCLVCDLNLEINSCINIFYTSLPRNGELLASFVLQVLHSAESDLRSSYVCSRCYNLFQMLEQAQWTVANIRSEILKVYRSGDKEKITKELVNGNTETTVLDVNNKIFMENFIQDEKLVIANTLSQLKDISSLRSVNCKSVNDEASQSIEHRSMVEDHLIEQNLSVSNINTTVDINNLKVIDEVGSKCNAKNLLVPDNVRSNVSNITSTGREQNNYVKIGKLNIKSNNKNVIGNEVASCVIDSSNLSVLKDDTFSKSFKAMTRLITNDAVTNLSRQEKMALYIRQCRICSRLFKSTNDLELHLLKHGGSRPYRCNKCEERFNDISLANIHAMEMHIEEKGIIDVATEPCKGDIVDFMNDDCIFPEEVLRMSDNEEQDDFEWKEASDIIVEIKENSENIKGNQLDQSNQNFDARKQIPSDSSQASWKSGRISKYSLKPLKYSCPTCGKKWRTSAELKTHMKSHSSLRPYMCEKCGQAYKHKHALEIHIGMHNGINPFQCSFCNKCFTQKGALMRHLPMHTGETPYQCELCGKRFVHHTSYNMHALSHTGKKSYRCHVCDLSLLSTSHLKRHMRVHTGEKPYSCSLCGKRFAERYNLFAHQKIHDPAEIIAKEAKKTQYKCEQCMVLFDKKQKLDDHVKHQHNLEIDMGNDRKWVDTTVDIHPQQVIELPKFYAPQSQNQNPVKMDTQNNLMVGQTWQQVNYQKLQSIDGVTKVLQSQNPLTQIGANSLAVTLDNHRMLMEAGYSRNLLPNVRALSGNHVPTDRAQI